MSFGEGISVKLKKRDRLDAEICAQLIENPHCLDGDSQKDEAYQIAINYFKKKQENIKAEGEVGCNKFGTMELKIWIKDYEDSVQCCKRQEECVRKMAISILKNGNRWISLIANETKDAAFKIIIEYLEQQRRS